MNTIYSIGKSGRYLGDCGFSIYCHWNSENPYSFKLENDTILCYQEKPPRGEFCLKMTTRVLVRTHGGYCSCLEMDEEGGPESEEEKIVVVYFRIPREYKNRRYRLRTEFYDNRRQILETEKTKKWFLEWQQKSFCDGSSQTGWCDYYDVYIPIRLEYTVAP
jgi:hypothetical protein